MINILSDGVFQNIQYAYTYRDTLIYGDLLHPDFQFRYFNSDRGTDVSFNRDEEMRITWNLFRGADQIDLQWTSIYSQNGDSIFAVVTRGYNLRITLQASETFIIEGLATLRLTRENPTDPMAHSTLAGRLKRLIASLRQHGLGHVLEVLKQDRIRRAYAKAPHSLLERSDFVHKFSHLSSVNQICVSFSFEQKSEPPDSMDSKA